MPAVTREYNKIEYVQGQDFVTKSSTTTRLRDEIQYYIDIQKLSHISLMFPQLIGCHIAISPTEKSWLQLELIAHDTLGTSMVEQCGVNWESVAKSLRTRLSCLHDYKYIIDPEEQRARRRSMYVHKTVNEYNALLSSPRFSALGTSDVLIINDMAYRNFRELWLVLDDYIEDKLINTVDSLSVIHGDLCFSNILAGYSRDFRSWVLKFIDPRGAFGHAGIYGDKLYDYAKLLHSYEGGYEYIIYDKFNLYHQVNAVLFSFKNDSRKQIAEQMNPTLFPNRVQYLHAKLISGLIFIGMCARHYDSSDRQVVMYCTGIQILNQVCTELGLCKSL